MNTLGQHVDCYDTQGQFIPSDPTGGNDSAPAAYYDATPVGEAKYGMSVLVLVGWVGSVIGAGCGIVAALR